MSDEMQATVTLVAGDHFTARVDGSDTRTNLAPAEAEISGTLSPMATLLVALGGCLGMSVAPIIRKMRQPITRYEIRVSGERAERPPRAFETILVEHIFTGPALDERALHRAVELAETRYCGVSAMLGKAAHITSRITLVEA